MEWIYVRDELPREGLEVFIIRGWEGSARYPVKARRNTSRPLTINEDMSRDCWWRSEGSSLNDEPSLLHQQSLDMSSLIVRDCWWRSEGSSFSDATVIAWLKIPEPVIPAFEGVDYEFPPTE